ncbi:MAG: DUF4332 domain-containing protein [Cyanobacteria bacterium K_DeepCast_35m_m2_155]|nr:DUF4332 domain-containing protein [Cyanobacteria bacterium K_DeepCast_35m_m2_155]
MDDLNALPAHFSREIKRLREAGITSWAALAALDAAMLRSLGRAGGASEARLIRLRAQARLVVDVELAPGDAALLLHAGIATSQGLAQAEPHRLLQQVVRLQRRLIGAAAVPLDLTTLRGWIRRAASSAGRSTN